MKLGNLITLTLFTILSIFFMVDGYNETSSQFLIGLITFVICLLFWTSYFNRYNVFKKNTYAIELLNKELKYKVECLDTSLKLNEEINKLANEQIAMYKDLKNIDDVLIKEMKINIKDKSSVIKSQEKIIKELTEKKE
jgi:hypothetical protein